MKCACCGKDIGEFTLDKSFQMPDEIWALDDEEREREVKIDVDKCIFKGRCFLRGVAYFPINKTDDAFGWGIWVEVEKNNFIDYLKKYSNDNSNEPIFIGKISNEISKQEITLGTEVKVQLGNETQRPTFEVLDENTQLYKDQKMGISLEKVHQINEQ